MATPEAVYVIAGFSGAERQDVWRHDLKNGSWTEVVPLDAAKKLPPRSVFGATAVANLLVGAVSIPLFRYRGWSV